MSCLPLPSASGLAVAAYERHALREALAAPNTLDVERLAPLLAVEFGKAGFFRASASMDFLTQQAWLMLSAIAKAYEEDAG